MFYFLFILCSWVVNANWAPGWVKHYFHDTPYGQLHYVLRGNVKANAPLVFFHGHPRSTEQIRYISEAIPDQPLLAIDYFGAGLSTECNCDEHKNEFVPFEVFARHAMEIKTKHEINKVIPFGSLTGASPAIEFAALASVHGHVEKMILHEAYYLSPKVKTYVDNVYIPTIRSIPLFINGSHLIHAWYTPDAGPLGPTSLTPVPQDLIANQQKTLDFLVNARTGWQFKMAWTAYNDRIPIRLTEITATNTKTLLLHGAYADWQGDYYGLDQTWSEKHINQSILESNRFFRRITNGTQGLLEQNVTLVANIMKEFMNDWQRTSIHV